MTARIYCAEERQSLREACNAMLQKKRTSMLPQIIGLAPEDMLRLLDHLEAMVAANDALLRSAHGSPEGVLERARTAERLLAAVSEDLKKAREELRLLREGTKA